ncbi:hypothetical protein FO519_008844 [Halicephalobus sp. NKZ332]|nr:hypothetical protein FO519_008844 [Halicephalobus sp. NKZ332]
MKLLVIFALVGTTFSLAIHPKDDGPNCGLKDAPKIIRKPADKGASFACEMCLDLTQIVVMYAECGEAYLQIKLDQYCDNVFQSGSVNSIVCKKLINDVMGELEKGTDVNDSDLCTKILKSKCQYAGPN